METVRVPEDPNFVLAFGSNDERVTGNVEFCLVEDRTLIKRLKWFLFCLVFPCKVIQFDKRKIDRELLNKLQNRKEHRISEKH